MTPQQPVKKQGAKTGKVELWIINKNLLDLAHVVKVFFMQKYKKPLSKIVIGGI